MKLNWIEMPSCPSLGANKIQRSTRLVLFIFFFFNFLVFSILHDNIFEQPPQWLCFLSILTWSVWICFFCIGSCKPHVLILIPLPVRSNQIKTVRKQHTCSSHFLFGRIMLWSDPGPSVVRVVVRVEWWGRMGKLPVTVTRQFLGK